MENHFGRLPTEVIISIFDRILDAKCLCICYSVCKYFAAHVLQTRIVLVEIPYTIGQGFGMDPVTVWPPGAMNFLKKLCCVESATIKFSLRNPNPSDSRQIFKSLVWWKSDSFGFIFVSVDSCVDFLNTQPKFTSDDDDALLPSVLIFLQDFKSRFCHIKELLLVLPNLKNISAVDSVKQMSIVLEEEGIASMKKENPLEGRGKLCVREWTTHSVMMSFSGCEMKNVALILTSEIGASDGLMAENLSEENKYREVIMAMMKKQAYSESVGVPGTIGDVSYMSLDTSLSEMVRIHESYKVGYC